MVNKHVNKQDKGEENRWRLRENLKRKMEKKGEIGARTTGHLLQ